MVYFVGAGPGAKDLITLRGKLLIEGADVIIYAGSLVNAELLSFAKQGCVILDSAVMTLDEVVDSMLDAALARKTVVRLHTGDPSVYGAIREQMDRLDACGVEYEICPGVSSFCAAAASLKAEYTLPGVSQTVILTRAAGRTGGVPARESIMALASHNATMVIFLSAGLLDTVSAELVAGGYEKDTPAAIVYKASWRDEKVVRCTVEDIAKSAADLGVSGTALICVGKFLEDEYTLSRLYSSNYSTGYRQAKVCGSAGVGV